MLDFLVALATFAFALIVAYARFDLLTSYYIVGAVYAVCVGVLLGNQERRRLRPLRLHLYIGGVCGCFLVMWYVSGRGGMWSSMPVENMSPREIAERLVGSTALLYAGIFLAVRASPALTKLIERVPIRIGQWADVFVQTSPDEFDSINRKVRSILVLTLLIAGIVAAATGNLPTARSIAGDFAAAFGAEK